MASVTIPPAATVTAKSTTRRNYARIIEQTWIWSVVGYALLRFFIAWGAFSEHGANPWIFGIIDVGTAWPYAKAVALVCKRASSNEWKRLWVPLTLAIGMFFAPYAYLWFGAGEMPAGMRVGMAICVSVLLIAASTGVISKTRKMRRESAAELVDLTDGAEQPPVRSDASSGQYSGATSQLMIDLTSNDADHPGTSLRS